MLGFVRDFDKNHDRLSHSYSDDCGKLPLVIHKKKFCFLYLALGKPTRGNNFYVFVSFSEKNDVFIQLFMLLFIFLVPDFQDFC